MEQASTQNQPLSGQVILVTGGARRIGQAICEELWAHGATVAIHYHQSTLAAQALAERLGDRAVVICADLRDRTATETMFAELGSRLGRVSGLVNSAAVFEKTPIETLSDEKWDEVLALNLTAPRRCMQLAIAAGACAIVNIVDVGAIQPWRGYSAYGVAKAGLLHLTRIVAKELRGQVRVNAVAPGLVLLPEDVAPAERARLLGKTAGPPPGSPQDVARAVRYLLCEPFVTGVCLPVDGGQSL